MLPAPWKRAPSVCQRVSSMRPRTTHEPKKSWNSPKPQDEFHGIYTTHMRSEGDAEPAAIAEAVRIGQEGGMPIHISHHKVLGKQNWGKSVDTLKMMAEARDRGVEVTCDQYPYRAGSTFLAAVLPPAVLAGGPEVFTAKLKDRSFRARVVETIERGSRGGVGKSD